ncbi:hypothetical protein [Streptomyces sp. WAC04114]|uniref:hypothetical protein n=1 Tax=Streptomyces sp. WAC04114 TaxID=2867961 RepID=UPI001C8CBE94|nr:hypothetical protein [Streptomyces sp. WAC04114]MBX9363855.1 hypothetical protein [Streptomyces sp. WAC04114]
MGFPAAWHEASFPESRSAALAQLSNLAPSAGQAEQEPQGRQATVRAALSAGFEIEIDPELDAQFGPRPVNGVQAAGIVTDNRPGAL